MAVKTVIWTTSCKINCGGCPLPPCTALAIPIVICIQAGLLNQRDCLITNASTSEVCPEEPVADDTWSYLTLPGTLVEVRPASGGWAYSLIYDDSYVVDPALAIRPEQITGIICNSCLINYINDKAGFDINLQLIETECGSTLRLTNQHGCTYDYLIPTPPEEFYFIAAGDAGIPQTIESGETLTISGGSGCSSLAFGTDIVRINVELSTDTDNAIVFGIDNGLYVPIGAGFSFIAAGDTGIPQTIENGDTLTIEGGLGCSSIAFGTDIVQINVALSTDVGNVITFGIDDGIYVPTGAGFSFIAAGTGGINQTITQGNTLLFTQGSGITTTGLNTDTISITARLSADSGNQVAFGVDGGLFVAAGAAFSFTAAGTGGINQTITNGNTLLLTQGSGITTTGLNTDTISITARMSADAGNVATFGVDGGIYVPTPTAFSFTAAGTGGINQTITNGNTLLFTQGSGITTTGLNTDTISITARLSADSGNQVAFGVDGGLFVAAGAAGSFNAAGDSGTPQPIVNGNTLTIAGGTACSSVASATDTVTLNVDVSVTAGNAITVDGTGLLVPTGAGFSFTAAGTGGINQTISQGNTLLFTQGSGITTTGLNTDTISITARLSADAGNSVAFGVDGGLYVPALASGTYTPTLTNVANLDSSTAYACQYLRVGNTVTVSGRVDMDATLVTTTTQLGLTLPIASNFTNAAVNQCAGTAVCPTVAGMAAAVVADTTNDRATIQFTSTDLGSRPWWFTFTYQVV